MASLKSISTQPESGAPFDAARADAVVAQVAVERLDDRVHLPRVADGRDHEVVGERRHLADIHQHDVVRLSVREQVSDALREVDGLQSGVSGNLRRVSEIVSCIPWLDFTTEARRHRGFYVEGPFDVLGVSVTLGFGGRLG